MVVRFCFFKQKTAYEMRISDWSSDVCSSDLVVRGDAAMLRRPCVAIVGARNASAIACRFARQLAADLAARDVTVVSGLARGVDTAAHIGALGGATVGVIGSGIDVAFPPEKAALQEKIASGQLLIAEHPPRTHPLARPFPPRNPLPPPP